MHLIYPRDERLLHLLDEHLVLTTEQINEALFGALRSCQRRLAHLKDLDLLDSFGTPRDPPVVGRGSHAGYSDASASTSMPPHATSG